MPDAPDGYRYRIESGRHALSDMAELAVRLGSVVSYHRSGTVIFADGMDYGTAPYLPQHSAQGDADVLPVVFGYQGGLAVKLIGSTATTNASSLLKRIQPVTLGKVGLEITFSLETANEAYTLQIQRNDGDDRYVFGIRFDSTNDLLFYRTGSTAWTEVCSLPLYAGDKYLFYAAKLVVDLVNNVFVKLYINQTEIDLSDYEPWKDDDDTKPRLEFMTGVNSRSGENDIAYIDNFIITTDEP